MKIVALQLDCVWEDPRANFAKVEHLLATQPPEPGSLVVLSEMFATGFSLDLAKTCAGAALETSDFLRTLARRYRVAVLGGATRPGRAGLGLNEAIAFAPDGSELARYQKQYPFTGAGEDAVHERGHAAVTFEWGGLRIAPLICYDLRFPEPFRAAARVGAELFAVLAAWPATRIEHWLTLLRARAIENQAFVIGVNRTGAEPKSQYCGRSVIIDPQGTILADAGETETLLPATLDPQAVRDWRAQFPAYRDFLSRP